MQAARRLRQRLLSQHGHQQCAACIRILPEQAVTFLLISHKPRRWCSNRRRHQKAHESSFQRYVCEWECCQVLAYELETFHRRRSNGIFHCETRRTTPQFPFARRGPPSNIAMPRPTARTTPNRSSDGWGTVAHRRRKVPIGYNGASQIRPPKVPLPVDRSLNPTICLIPVRPTMLNGIQIRSPFVHNALDRQTDRPTDRSSTGKFDDYSRYGRGRKLLSLR